MQPAGGDGREDTVERRDPTALEKSDQAAEGEQQDGPAKRKLEPPRVAELAAASPASPPTVFERADQAPDAGEVGTDGGGRIGKKRPREDMRDGDTGAPEERSVQNSDAAERMAIEAENEERTQAITGRGGGGDAGERVPDGNGTDVLRRAYKPMDDAKLKEVVLQDLASQEIRRVFRKGVQPPAGSDKHEDKSALANPSGDEQKDKEKLPNGTDSLPNGKSEEVESRALAASSGRAIAVASLMSRPSGQSGASGESFVANATPVRPEKGDAARKNNDVREDNIGAVASAQTHHSDKAPNGVFAAKPGTPLAETGDDPAKMTGTERALGRIAVATVDKVGAAARVASGDESSGGGSRGAQGQSRGKTGVADGEGARPRGQEHDGPDTPRSPENVKGGGGGGGGGGGRGDDAAPAESVRERCPEHALPVARAFFDFETVSGFERRMLPEFFTGRSASKTPEMYLQSRNYIIRSYKRMLEADRDAQAYLTGTECRRKLAGDACATLRIHEFLDRFGLINTRAGGKRASFAPVPPPSMNVWHPLPPERSRREAKGARSEHQQKSGRDWGGDAERQAQRTHAGIGEREWHRKELVRLMEAAVASPNQWDAVAHQVGGGHTPAACMRQFLNLAVEEVLTGDRDEENEAPLPSAPPPVPTPKVSHPLPEAVGDRDRRAGGSSIGGDVDSSGQIVRDTKPAADPVEMAPPASSKLAASDAERMKGEDSTVGRRTLGDADDASPSTVGSREERTARRLVKSAPALMLASALASHVHPEVMRAAMSAATVAAEEIALRSTASRDGKGARTSVDAPDDSKGQCALPGSEEEDIEMRDAPGSTPAESVSGSRGFDEATNTPQQEASRATTVTDSAETLLSVAELEASRTTAARAAVLSVAGLQARGLAELEDRRTEALVSDLLEARVQRLETKLHCLDELDQVLEIERQSLEHDRAELMADQARSMSAKS